MDLQGGTIPWYWDTDTPEDEQPANYLTGKINTIKMLHKQYGKDCFSFILMADIHYPSNLGKISPVIAKRIADQCCIKYIICTGDTQTRGCWNTKEELLTENAELDKFFSPIIDRLLRTEGNHDGAWGRLDKDGDTKISNNYPIVTELPTADIKEEPYAIAVAGTSDPVLYDVWQYIDGEWVQKAESTSNIIREPINRETYVYNLTPQEMHENIYREVGMVGDVHFDDTGTAYYVDDTANNVRYIGLNTHYNDYKTVENGTVKYPKMWIFRFTQAQFDFLTKEALAEGMTDKTKVVVFGHCPLWQEIGDRDIMIGVLNAYKTKGTYSGVYEGTAAGGAMYENKAEPLPDNTTDTTKWVKGYRIASSGIVEETAGVPSSISNVVSCKFGDIIRISGVTLRKGTDRVIVRCNNFTTGAEMNLRGYFNDNLVSGAVTYLEYLGEENGVYTFKCHDGSVNGAHVITGFRFAMPTPEDASKVIITVNEEIVEAEHGYDYVSVDCDFSTAKGKLVGYFAGHVHQDKNTSDKGFSIITTRCDAKEDYTAELREERVAGTVTEQSFDVFTVTPSKIYATKIGVGNDREISY